MIGGEGSDADEDDELDYYKDGSDGEDENAAAAGSSADEVVICHASLLLI